MTTTLLVITPWIATYNVPFFDRLDEALKLHDVRLVVARCDAPPSMARRGDMSGGPWAKDLVTSWVTLGGWEIPRRRVASIMREVQPDLVVVEQALHNPETYPLMARSAAGRYGVAMWGHGRSFSTPQSTAAAMLKQGLTRRADWFFAHTQSGADHVVAHGFPRTRVSVLRNTIDTERLRADLEAVDPGGLEAFRRHHDLAPGRTALFLGGVDERKGIGFLLESARIAGELLPGFVLLVAGDGASLSAARAAQAAGVPIRVLGRTDGPDKALALRAAALLAIPEWIGLVAVDALVSGRPIITTDHPSHSPEYEYLVPGQTMVVSAHTSAEYARALVSTLSATERLAEMQAAARHESYRYTLDGMVDAFVEGVLGWADLRRAGLTRGTHPSAAGGPGLGRGEVALRGGSLAVVNGSPQPRRLAVLMACHNRREQTLSCLRSLTKQEPAGTELRVYLTDDGSTDGTATAVAAVDLPLRVIAGTGELFWAAGMALAEREAVRDNPDLLLWLNDDVILDPDGLARLLAVHEQSPGVIVVGDVRDPDTGVKTYGGRNLLGRHPQRFSPVSPGDQVQQVSAFNGNVVLIPRAVRKIVGPIDGVFAHAIADDDYGLRASKLGVEMLCAPGTVGSCALKLAGPVPSGVRGVWKQLQAPASLPWRSQVRYLRRHGGIGWPAYFFWGYGKALLRPSIRSTKQAAQMAQKRWAH